jgi:hypothetical protein
MGPVLVQVRCTSKDVCAPQKGCETGSRFESGQSPEGRFDSCSLTEGWCEERRFDSAKCDRDAKWSAWPRRYGALLGVS